MANNIQTKFEKTKNHLNEAGLALANALKKEHEKYEVQKQETIEKIKETETYQELNKVSNKINSEVSDTIHDINTVYQDTQAELAKQINHIFDNDETIEVNTEQNPVPSETIETATEETPLPTQTVEVTNEEVTTPEVTTSSNIDTSMYNNNTAKGFEVTTDNKTYELTAAEKELLYAIVAAESDKSPDDALAVATTILNRCESPQWTWIKGDSSDPITQATAPNQFVVYQDGYYKQYMNGNAPDTVVKAVDDALAGVRNHEYLSFRSNNTTSYSSNMITSTGNRYK